jgi:hypothetical protein
MTDDGSTTTTLEKDEGSTKAEPLYTALVNIRNTELSVYWTRYNIQSAINFVLLAAALASGSDSFARKHMALTVVAGLLTSIVWLLFIAKGKQLLMNRWERHIRAYEDCTPEVKYKLFTIHSAEEALKSAAQSSWDNLTDLAAALPALCIIVWIVILTISIISVP